MEKIYRDSVHNIIRIETGTPEGELLVSLIDTPEFQRLRRVRQLGLAYFAYQAAEHSRFAHSLGAFHLATRILDRSESGTPSRTRNTLRSALPHSPRHRSGPFSHVIESILGFHHEQFTIDAVLSKETEIGRKLAAYSPSIAEMSRRSYAAITPTRPRPTGLIPA